MLVLKRHGFSRAKTVPKTNVAFGPRGTFLSYLERHTMHERLPCSCRIWNLAPGRTLYSRPANREKSHMGRTVLRIVFLCLALCCITPAGAQPASASDDVYERAIQRALAAVYSGQYANAEKEFAGMEQLQPGFPAPSVYRELLDSWRAADDPGNSDLVSVFQRDSAIAISACRDWIAKHPQDPDGWRYLASAYGQVSQFAVSVVPSPMNAARFGRRMHIAVLKARSLETPENQNPDTLLGLGAYDYFASRLPARFRPFAWLLGISGDREKGLSEIEEAMHHGRHLKIEAAMVRASAYWSEGQYGDFVRTIEENIVVRYPALLPARMWQISACICDGHLAEARELALRIPAQAYWRNFQLGRIELAKQDEEGARNAITFFNQSMTESGPSLSILTWDYVGRDLAFKRIGEFRSESWRQDKRVSPAAIPMAGRYFNTPHQCSR